MVVEALSEQEQATAASASYAYWAWEKTQPLDSGIDPKDKEEVRIRMAMREARRHFVGQNGNYDVAVERLKHMVQWRQVRVLREFMMYVHGSTFFLTSTNITNRNRRLISCVIVLLNRQHTALSRLAFLRLPYRCPTRMSNFVFEWNVSLSMI